MLEVKEETLIWLVCKGTLTGFKMMMPSYAVSQMNTLSLIYKHALYVNALNDTTLFNLFHYCNNINFVACYLKKFYFFK